MSITNTSMPLITVIVPVYNVENYIVKCIESIIGQTYKNLEVFLVDDGSTDGSGRICDEYAAKDDRIHVIHKENGGQSSARNLALSKAKGDLFGFVDSDDWIEPDMYEKLMAGFELPDVDIVMCGYYIEEYSEKKILRKNPEKIYSNREALEALVRIKICSNLWNKLYKRELFDGIAFPEGRFYEDTVVMHRLIARVRLVKVLDVCMYHHILRDRSTCHTVSAKMFFDYTDAALDRYDFLKENQAAFFEEEKSLILLSTLQRFSIFWRNWYKMKKDEKKRYAKEVRRLRDFARKNVGPFGIKGWPLFMRFSSLFLRNDSRFSFALYYGLNRLYDIVRPNVNRATLLKNI